MISTNCKLPNCYFFELVSITNVRFAVIVTLCISIYFANCVRTTSRSNTSILLIRIIWANKAWNKQTKTYLLKKGKWGNYYYWIFIIFSVTFKWYYKCSCNCCNSCNSWDDCLCIRMSHYYLWKVHLKSLLFVLN